ncbi:VOC family protein [Pseudonocardia sp. C8]|uniref:VOC family protein n=1 Tax=Pseudonocardia sp. C8 TaxID=2762759 RepID=UPI0016428561|nr:VOC family protein [Pseudonocardia sp. C8]MBC3189794.1 VOC family protein [Pseudonocardia sp. C8]
MDGVPSGTTATCACCGEPQKASDVVRLGCRPDIAVCGGCVYDLAGRLVAGPTITPIFPVNDMAAAREFWTRAGLQVDEYGPEYAFVRYGTAELLHLDLRRDLEPERNAAACYVRVSDPREWQRRWKDRGLPVSDVVVQPWGMVEFSVKDPSGNLIRMGAAAERGPK